MAQKQSGPVKPPTLDMQARKPSPRTPSKSADAAQSASTEETAAKPDPAPRPSDSPKTEPAASSRPAQSRGAPESPQFPLLPAALSAATGAALAVLIILGLASTGLLSGLMPQTSSGDSERLTFAEEQVSEALVGFNALNRQVSDLSARFDTAQSGTSDTLDQLASRQDELDATLENLPAPETTAEIDFSPLETRIDQLDNRLAALQSGASPEQADALASDLADLRAGLEVLSGQVSTLSLDVAELDNNLTVTSQGLMSESEVITSLQAEIASLKSDPALPYSDTQLLRLPLALSGLETALEGGRPFVAELQSLLTLVPQLSASDELNTAAEAGLPGPGQLVTAFSRDVPSIMAARPVDPDASMVDGLWARAQAMFAIRPTGETGADPVSDALARAEDALANRRFAAAAEALSQLPVPMQAAAGETLTAITLMAEAETLLADARASVLVSSTPPAAAPAPAQETATTEIEEAAA